MLLSKVGLQSQKLAARKTTFFTLTPPNPIPTKREDCRWEGDCRPLGSETQNLIKGLWSNKHCTVRSCIGYIRMRWFVRFRCPMLSRDHAHLTRALLRSSRRLVHEGLRSNCGNRNKFSRLFIFRRLESMCSYVNLHACFIAMHQYYK
jgi:hypothetical protein